MNHLTPGEYMYIRTVLARTSSYTIARAEQIDLPTVNHKLLTRKIDNISQRMHR